MYKRKIYDTSILEATQELPCLLVTKNVGRTMLAEPSLMLL